jgi:hypothetical protein
MGWTMLYLFVFLKLPILALGGIVYWAIKQTDEEEPVLVRDDGGAPKPRRPHPRPKRPRPPRRGPHGSAASRMASPPRVRSVTAFGRADQAHSRRGSSRPLGE